MVEADHEVVVVERSASFSLGVSNLGLMTGERELSEVTRPMASLRREGIEWLQAEVRRIDPVRRTVETDRSTLTADYLVLALGAELAPDSVPGFAEAAHNLYEPDGAVAIYGQLQQLKAGRIVVLVAGAPFRCPAAPYEAAMLVDGWTRDHGSRDQLEIDLYTPEAAPMAVAGPAVGDALRDFLEQRGISAHFSHQVTRIDASSQTVRFGQQKLNFDLLIGIPPHRAPGPVRDAGLTDASGYVPVHPQTLEILSDLETLHVQYPGVYAIGDVAAVRLMNSMLLPKAGVFAEGQAQVVAATIAADIEGVNKPPGFDGEGFCYVDVGDGTAAYGSGNFYAYPAPRVTLEPPSESGRRAKDQYEDLLDSWFG